MRISKIIWGLLFVLVGIVCLLSVFGVIPWADNISWTDFLPLVLAVLGLTWLIDSNVRFMGVVFLAIGVYWTLQNLGVFDVSVGKIMIPVLLVALGVSILTPPRKKYRRGSAGGAVRNTNASRVCVRSTFSESRERVQSDTFQGGKVTAVFGASTLDLTGTAIDPAGAYVSATAVFGGVDILVPEGTNVETQGFIVFGGSDHKHRGGLPSESVGNGVLTVAISGAFGGVEIKYL